MDYPEQDLSDNVEPYFSQELQEPKISLPTISKWHYLYAHDEEDFDGAEGDL